jgi:hypothetical protein
MQPHLCTHFGNDRLGVMRITDPHSGRSYLGKRLRRNNEPGQPPVREGSQQRHRFWQPGGAYDRNITTPGALRAMIDYVHAHPVRRGLVARAEDWDWSSAPWYAGSRPVKIEFDERYQFD